MSKGQIEYKANGAEFALDRSAYEKAQEKGRVYAGGGDVLVMEIGQITGPWKVVEVLRDQKLNAKYKPVDVILAECNRRRMRMPAATSFRDKAKSADLQEGDTFIVERSADYRANGKDCESYILTVTSARK